MKTEVLKPSTKVAAAFVAAAFEANTQHTHETDFQGLREPFVLLGMEPANTSQWQHERTIFLEKYLTYFPHVPQRPVWEREPIDETIIPTTVTLPQIIAVEKLFVDQIDTLQPNLGTAIISGLLKFVTSKGGAFLEDHGGGARRLTTISHKKLNSEEVFKTYFRWEGNELLNQPKNGSEIPEHEKLAEEVLTHVTSHGLNLDLYGPCNPQEISEAPEFVTDQIINLLVDSQTPYHIEQGPSGVEIHIPYSNKLWKPHQAFGWSRKYNQDPQRSYRSEETIFSFGPKIQPEKFVIKMNVFSPPANPKLSILQIAFGPTSGNSFLDVSEIFLNAIPTVENGLDGVDARHGSSVDSRQREMHATFYTDGRVEVPHPYHYEKHQSRLPLDFISQTTDINRLPPLFSRPFRYGVHTDTFGSFDTSQYSFSQKHEATFADLGIVLHQMLVLHNSGQYLSRAKLIEMLADLVVATHNQGDLLIQALNRTKIHMRQAGEKLERKQRDIVSTDIFPRNAISRLSVMPKQGPRYTSGTAVISEDGQQLTWSSGIPTILIHIQREAEKYLYEHVMNRMIDNPDGVEPIPNASPLAQLLWLLEPFPTTLGRKTIYPQLANQLTYYPKQPFLELFLEKPLYNGDTEQWVTFDLNFNQYIPYEFPLHSS